MTKFLMPWVAVLALTAAWPAAPALAQSAYDGDWSVLVVTDAGTCDRAYRYAVRIDRGVVRYAGEAGINLSGRVSNRGAVSVSVSRGSQVANGSGRMTRTSGAGRWSGRSGGQQCSGTWEAERR